MNRYENVSHAIELKINEKLEHLRKLADMMTAKEQQYSFLKFLQNLPLAETQVFDIYTNTEI